MIKFRSQILLLAIALALASISVTAYNRNYERICKKINLCEEKTFIKCKIESFPKDKNGKTSFCARIIQSDEAWLVGEGIYVSAKGLDTAAEKGDEAELSAKLQLAQTNGNEGAFDYRNYLKSLDVAAVCYPGEGEVKIIEKDSPLKAVYGIRRNFVKNCEKYIKASGGGLVSAVITGDRTGIDEESADAFKKSGIYHIVAISGLHLNLFVLAVYAAIAKTSAKGRKKALLSLVLSAAVGIFVMIFTGFGVSVIRAFIMMLILGGGAVFRREYSGKNALLTAGFVIVISMPYSIYSVAMQLSFLSTLGVLVSSDVINALKEREKFALLTGNYIGNTFVTSVMTTLLTLPVTTASFGFVPMYGWIANVFVLPVMSYFMASGVIFALVSALLPQIFTAVCGAALTAASAYINAVARLVSSLPFAATDTYANALWFLFICIVIFVLYIRFVNKNSFKRAIAILLIFAVAGGGFLMYNKADSSLHITFADVGQGDCTLVQVNGCDIMIDCGTQGSSDYTASAVEAMLRAKNIKKLDAIVITHYHTDHTNIAADLLEKGKTELLVLPLYYDFTESEAKNNRYSLMENAAQSNTKIKYVSAGSHIDCGKDAKFEVISPSDSMFCENNDMSLIMKLTYGKTKVMFFGDAEEKGLQQCTQKDIECDIMKLPHHGGHSGTAEEIIKICGAKYAVASCGENNYYGHPDSRVLGYLGKYGCKVYRTDESGAVSMKSDKKGNIKITTMR